MSIHVSLFLKGVVHGGPRAASGRHPAPPLRARAHTGDCTPPLELPRMRVDDISTLTLSLTMPPSFLWYQPLTFSTLGYDQ